MGISNVFGFFALFSIPFIILLYMLRPRHQKLEISSTFLWQQISEELSHAKKIEKIKKSILFILDILIAIVIALLLLGIFFSSSKSAEHHIILIDASFSMNSTDVEPSRFDRAKEMAEDYLMNLDEGTEVSLVLLKENSEVIYNKEKSKNAVRNAINNLKVSKERLDLSKISPLVDSLKDSREEKLIYFGDKKVREAENVLVNNNSDNIAITNMASKTKRTLLSSTNQTADSTDLSITVENQSSEPKEVKISLYDDELYLSTKSIDIAGESSDVVFFENINPEIKVLKAVIENRDGNPYDNVYYNIVSNKEKSKVALISHGNFFLEKYLDLNENFEVYKISPNEYVDLSGFDLYIFDSFISSKFPADGNILVLDANMDARNEMIVPSGYLENPSFNIQKHPVNQFIEDRDFSIGISQVYEKRRGIDPIYSVKEGYLAYSEQIGRQKLIVFGFDFRYTDLPLKAEFPILMNNLMTELTKAKMSDKYSYEASEDVRIKLLPSAFKAKLLKPDASEIILETKDSFYDYKGSKNLGLYKIVQLLGKEEDVTRKISYFAVNPPSSAVLLGENYDDKDVVISDYKTREDIDKVLFIILILLLIVELSVRMKKLGKTRKYKSDSYRKKILFYTRIVVILFIILSFIGIKISIDAKYTATIFVADNSKSVQKSINETNIFIRDSLKEIGKNDWYGIVSFAGNANVDKPLSENHSFYEIARADDGENFTNIEHALDRAQFMFLPDLKKRIVLITDGRENQGDLRKKASHLKEMGVTLDLYRIGEKEFPEIEIDKILLPKSAKKGQNIAVEVKIKSNTKTKSKIYLYGRNELIGKKDIEIDEGDNSYIFSSLVKDGGILEYRVEIVPENDTYYENNKLSTFIDVEDKLKLLIVQRNDAGQNYAEIFNDFEVDLVDEKSAPKQMNTLFQYDVFLLADVSLEKLPLDFVDHVEDLVKEQGKALIVSGGQNSYALGGYHDTKLEKMLPLNMDVKDREEKENLAIVLVIDKSGSMSGGSYGITKLELAIEAAIRSTEIIDEKDYLGVIAFDGASSWVLKLNKIIDKQKAQDKISTIRPGGGTSIQPALKDAIASLKDNDAAYRHIILLTDGQAEDRGYEEYIDDMLDNKITLSSVAVGAGADKKLLKYLADSSGGRFYVSDVFTDIPTIFAKETVMAGKKYLNNIEFYPKLKMNSPVFSEIDSLPKLYGYVATSEKPLAKVLLSGVDEDPILATYNYGLGKTVCFTSDMHGLWSKDWISWDKNQKLWRNLMGEILNQEIGEKYKLSCEYEGGEAVLSLQIDDSGYIKEKSIEGRVVSPTGEKNKLELLLKEPGLYQSKIKAKEEGLYLASFTTGSGGNSSEDAVMNLSSAFIVPYSDEFRFLSDNNLDLEEIALISGGRVLKSPSEVFEGNLPKVSSDYDLTKLFLILALILFLIELVFRMTNLRLSFLGKKMVKNKEIKELESMELESKNFQSDTEKNTENVGVLQKTKFAKKQNKKKLEEAKKQEKRSSYLDELLKK